MKDLQSDLMGPAVGVELEASDMTQTLLYGVESEDPSELTPDELRQGLGLPSGERISDYKSLYAIGVGGMGTVFGGYEPGLNREIALKLLRPQYRNQAARIEDFIREARTTAQIDHPNIVPVHRLGVFDDVGVYFTMKKIEGETLQTILRKIRENTEDYRRRYTLRRLLNIFLGCCHGVSFAHHHGILHCDLKPGNLMIGNYGEVFVVDWGMACYLPELDGKDDQRKMAIELECKLREQPRDEKKLGGTWAFMAPELLAGQSSPSVSTDIYALGTILYTILSWQASPVPDGVPVNKHPGLICSGKIPSVRRAARSRTEVPRELEAICAKAMNFNPEKRFVSVEEMISDVQNFLDDYPVKAYSPRWGYRLGKMIQRHPLIPTTLLVALITWVMFLGYNTSLERTQIRSHWNFAMDCYARGNHCAGYLKKQINEMKNDSTLVYSRDSIIQMRRMMYEMLNDYSAALDFLSRIPEEEWNVREVREMAGAIFTNCFSLIAKFNEPSASDNILHNISLRWQEIFALAGQQNPQLITWVEMIRNEAGSLNLAVPEGKIWTISIMTSAGEYAEGIAQEPLVCRELEYIAGNYTFLLPVGNYKLSIRENRKGPVFIPFVIDQAQELRLMPQLPEQIPPGFVPVLDGQLFSALSTGSLRRIYSRKLPGFYIGRYEVRFRDYIAFLKKLPPELRRKYTPKLKGKFLWNELSGLAYPFRMDLPVVGVTAEAAQAYCEFLGKKYGLKGRLPSRDEWLRAASGIMENKYVWGNEFNAQAALTADHPETELYPVGAERDKFLLDESVYGVRNLAGNVREIVWMETAGKPYYLLAGSSWNTPLFTLDDNCMNYGECQVRDAGFRCLLEMPRNSAADEINTASND